MSELILLIISGVTTYATSVAVTEVNVLAELLVTCVYVKYNSRTINTINNISRVINTIRLTKGDGWAAKVVDDNGQPVFTPVEQQRYTELFKPYLSSIVSFFNDKDNHTELFRSVRLFLLTITLAL